MVAHVYLKKDCLVPRHSHENEQFSYVLEGKLLTIPSNLPHKALALVDSLSVDIFCPPRQDWLDGSDAYLRNAGGSGGAA